MAFCVYNMTFSAYLIAVVCSLAPAEAAANDCVVACEQAATAADKRDSKAKESKSNEGAEASRKGSGAEGEAEPPAQPTEEEPSGQAEEAPLRIVVVVNKKNPIKKLKLTELRRIFLREQERWPNGWKITVLERHSENPIREVFSRGVLKKEPDELKKYWIDLKLSRGVKPPKACPSTKLLMQYMKRVKGGVGYMYEHEVDKSVLKIVEVKGLDAELQHDSDDEQKKETEAAGGEGH